MLVDSQRGYVYIHIHTLWKLPPNSIHSDRSRILNEEMEIRTWAEELEFLGCLVCIWGGTLQWVIGFFGLWIAWSYSYFLLSGARDPGLPMFFLPYFHFAFDCNYVLMYGFCLNLWPHSRATRKVNWNRDLWLVYFMTDIFRLGIIWVGQITPGSSMFQLCRHQPLAILNLVSQWLLILQNIPFQLWPNLLMALFFPTEAYNHIKSAHTTELYSFVNYKFFIN